MKKHFTKIVILAAILALLDQLAKYFAANYFQEDFNIIPNFFKLQYAENTGIAFSIPIPFFLIIILNIFLILLIIYFAVREIDLSKKISILSLSLLFGGALGNIIDRIARGFVVDFISIWKWPSFNLADMYIVGGVLLIAVFYGKIKRV